MALMIMLFLSTIALAGPPPEAGELPEELAAVYIQAMASVQQGQHEEVARLLAVVNEGAPNFDDAFRNRCAAERFLDNGDTARQLCERAVAIEGSWVNHAALVRDALAAREFPEAARLAEVALGAHPGQLELQMLLCEAALRADDLGGLEACADAIDSSHGETAWAAYYRYALHVARGEREEAIAAMNKAVALDLPQRGRRQMALMPLPPESTGPNPMYIAAGGATTVALLGLGLLLFWRSRT